MTNCVQLVSINIPFQKALNGAKTLPTAAYHMRISYQLVAMFLMQSSESRNRYIVVLKCD